MGHSSDVHKLIMSDSGMKLQPMEKSPGAGSGKKEVLSTSISDRGKRKLV